MIAENCIDFLYTLMHHNETYATAGMISTFGPLRSPQPPVLLGGFSLAHAGGLCLGGSPLISE